MKLQHKIAGTILLPLAAAAMISTAQAADVTVGGSIRIHAAESTPKNGDMNFTADGADSRFTVKYKGDNGVTGMYEAKMPAGDLRHAFVTFDGITAGQTWKPSAALELLFPTVDATGNALTSAPSLRAAQISTKLDLGVGSLNVGVFDGGKGNDAVPDLAAKFVADMDGMKLIAAFEMQQYATAAAAAGFVFDTTTGGSKATAATAASDETETRLTAGVVAPLGGMTVQGVFTSFTNMAGVKSAKETYMGASVSVPMGDGLNFNAAFETATEAKTDAMWVNVMTKTASGVNLGLEYRNDHKETSVIDALIKYDF